MHTRLGEFLENEEPALHEPRPATGAADLPSLAAPPGAGGAPQVDATPPLRKGAAGDTPVSSRAGKGPGTPGPSDRLDCSHRGLDGIHDLLGDDEPAPRGEGGKDRIMSIEALLNLACPAVLEKCLDGADFDAAQIRQEVTPIKEVYANANVVGTALGDGVHGIGLRLWRGRRGLFRACRENAVLAAKRMKPEELEALARTRGLAGIQELAQAIQRLPSVKPASQS
jgi:hypothetical protein